MRHGSVFRVGARIGCLTGLTGEEKNIEFPVVLLTLQETKAVVQHKLGEVGKRIGSVSDLPEEIRAQIKSLKAATTEDKIIDVIADVYEGVASIDEILVGVYRKYKIVQKRHLLANKMYRMAKAGMLYAVKGKKGVYTTDKKVVQAFSA
jgi:hypothetical protein